MGTSLCLYKRETREKLGHKNNKLLEIVLKDTLHDLDLTEKRVDFSLGMVIS